MKVHIIIVLAIISTTSCSKSKKVDTLRVGAMAVAECSILQDTNAFISRGIELDILTEASGAQISDGVIGGGLDFGYSNLVSPILANARGIPLRIFGPVTLESVSKPRHALLVLNNGPIVTAQSLVGKRIALNALNNIDHVLLKRWLKSHGVDPKSIQISVLPFPDMLLALENGSVDAAACVEPFVTMAKRSSRMHTLGNYFMDGDENSITAVSGFVAKEEWLQKNPDLTRRITEALVEAANNSKKDYANSIKCILKMTKTPEDVVKIMPPVWYADKAELYQLNALRDAAVQHGIIGTNINVSLLQYN